MDFEKSFQVANASLFEKTGKNMSDVEKIVFEGSWNGQSYEQIATDASFTTDYLRGDIGHKFWHKLSDALGEKVTKKNFKSALEKKAKVFFNLGTINNYVSRTSLEDECFMLIQKNGSLIRIKAPRKMGKTLLSTQILNFSNSINYQTIYLNFSELTIREISNLELLLTWFIQGVMEELKESEIDDVNLSTIRISRNRQCTRYFEKNILQVVKTPLLISLDNVDRLFDVPEIADEFFSLLRSWYDTANTNEKWQKIRFIIIHSTEPYSTLNLNRSPFNVGTPVEPKEFSLEEMKTLASCYGLENLDWNLIQKKIGGHPYLLNQLFSYLKYHSSEDLEKILINSHRNIDLYYNYLMEINEKLEQNLALKEFFLKMLKTKNGIKLESIQERKIAFQLYSLGLVNIDSHSDSVTVRCDLYRLFFQKIGG